MTLTQNKAVHARRFPVADLVNVQVQNVSIRYNSLGGACPERLPSKQTLNGPPGRHERLQFHVYAMCGDDTLIAGPGAATSVMRSRHTPHAKHGETSSHRLERARWSAAGKNVALLVLVATASSRRYVPDVYAPRRAKSLSNSCKSASCRAPPSTMRCCVRSSQ